MSSRRPSLVCLLLLGLATPVCSQDDIRFQPRNLDASPTRVAGTIRGSADSLTIAVLAPGHLAVTAKASPALYWFASSTVPYSVELVLIEEGGEEPLIEVILQPPIKAGIHRFMIRPDRPLIIGAAYQWSVAAIRDPASRSNDVFSSTLMTRINRSEAMAFDTELERARSDAQAGIWYDAFDALSKAIEGPDPERARELRATLLDQVGLDEIARFERQQLE